MDFTRGMRTREGFRVAMQANDLTDCLDRIIEQAGPPPGDFRVLEVNKGFELQVPKLGTKGWTWKRECWSSSRLDLAAMARRRGFLI